MRKSLMLAWSALILDVVAFILSSVWLCATSNMAVMIILAILIYILAYDAFQASVYLVRQYKN